MVHTHFEPNFIAIIELEDKGDKTFLSWYKLYESKELFEMVERNYQTIECFKQTVAILENYLVKKLAKEKV